VVAPSPRLARPPARKVRRPASTPVNPGRQHEQDEKNLPPDANLDAMNAIGASRLRLYRTLAGSQPAARA
jgi:hypothetical protein